MVVCFPGMILKRRFLDCTLSHAFNPFGGVEIVSNKFIKRTILTMLVSWSLKTKYHGNETKYQTRIFY